MTQHIRRNKTIFTLKETIQRAEIEHGEHTRALVQNKNPYVTKVQNPCHHSATLAAHEAQAFAQEADGSRSVLNQAPQSEGDTTTRLQLSQEYRF